MTGANFHLVFVGLLNLALLAGTAVYAALVLMSFRTDSPHRRPRLKRRHPLRSAGRLLVWMGAEALTLVIRAVAPIFAILSEASADVGEWVLSRHHQETQ